MTATRPFHARAGDVSAVVGKGSGLRDYVQKWLPLTDKLTNLMRPHPENFAPGPTPYLMLSECNKWRGWLQRPGRNLTQELDKMDKILQGWFYGYGFVWETVSFHHW